MWLSYRAWTQTAAHGEKRIYHSVNPIVSRKGYTDTTNVIIYAGPNNLGTLDGSVACYCATTVDIEVYKGDNTTAIVDTSLQRSSEESSLLLDGSTFVSLVSFVFGTG